MAYVTRTEVERALELSRQCAEKSAELPVADPVRGLLVIAGLYLHKLGVAAEPYELPEVPSKYGKPD